MGYLTMEQSTPAAAVLDVRVLAHIRTTARHLARSCHLPGMDADDIAQDLFLDLWRRRHAFDPSRAAFPTFADRVVANRVTTLTGPTARLTAERNQVWLDAPVADHGVATLGEMLADPAAPTEADVALMLDMRRFVANLSPSLQRCCEIFLAPRLSEAVSEAGLHRSSVYENLYRLRRLAEKAGLRGYLDAPRQIVAPAGMCSP